MSKPETPPPGSFVFGGTRMHIVDGKPRACRFVAAIERRHPSVEVQADRYGLWINIRPLPVIQPTLADAVALRDELDAAILCGQRGDAREDARK